MKHIKWVIVLVISGLFLTACQEEKVEKDSDEMVGETDNVEEDEAEPVGSDDRSEAESVDNDDVEKSETESDNNDDVEKVDGPDIDENAENHQEPFEYDMDEITFRMDKDKEYVVKIVDDGNKSIIKQTYMETTENEKGIWDHWISADETEDHEFVVMEDEEGLYIGLPESEYYQEMGYPIEADATFDDWGDTYTTTVIDETISVGAGEFNHVVEVESPEGYVGYFAPNVGQIQVLDKDGNVVSELIELN